MGYFFIVSVHLSNPGDTSAIGLPHKAFIKLDFPDLGVPTKTILKSSIFFSQ